MKVAADRTHSQIPPLAAGVVTPVDVARWLVPAHVLLDVVLHDRRHAIDVAGNALAAGLHRADAAPVLRALWRRELAGSTALGSGVAIPHARIDGLARPATLFMRSRWAIPFEAPDSKPVVSFFVILVPSDGNPDDHLRLLSLVADAFLDRDFRAQLSLAEGTEMVENVFAERAKRCALVP